MPISKDQVLVPAPDTQETNYPGHHSTVLDTTRIHPENIVAHVEGKRWVVTYYARLMDKDDEAVGIMTNGAMILQQYREIEDFVLKVQDALTPSWDDKTSSFTYTGSSCTLPATIVPRPGDMFVADIGVNRKGVFQVLSFDRLSVMLQSSYRITYNWVGDQSSDTYKTTLESVVDRAVFVEDHLEYGKVPVVSKSDYETLLKLGTLRQQSIQWYFDTFYDKYCKTIMVPKQEVRTFDPYLANFCLSTLGQHDDVVLQNMQHYPMLCERRMSSSSVLDRILNPTDISPHQVTTQFGTLSSALFSGQARLRGLITTNIRRLVYPRNPPYTVNMDHDVLPSAQDSLVYPEQPNNVVYTELVPDPSGLINLPLILPVSDAAYIFSESLYAGTALSQLELLVWKHFKGENPDPNMLKKLYDSSPNWGIIELFYYMPVLCYLTKQQTGTL